MDIFENPFWILSATLRDNRHRLMELADEKSLLADADAVSSASNVLTNPRRRLGAEMAWLPGLGPKRAEELITQLQSDPKTAFDQRNIPALARANLLVAGLKTVAGKIDTAHLSRWIIEIARAFDAIEPEAALALVNEEREISGFPAVTDHHAIESEINNRKQQHRAVIKDALNRLPSIELVGVVTDVVESVTGTEDMPAPLLIDALVDTYEVEAQEFFDIEEANIDNLLDRIRTAADTGVSDSVLSPVVVTLIKIVKNWHIVAQPIQISTKGRGLEHRTSTRVARKVRNVGIHLFSEHNKLDLSYQITSMLQEVFANVVEIAEQIKKYNIYLEEVAEMRRLDNLFNPILCICENLLNDSKNKPNDTPMYLQIFYSSSVDFLNNLQRSGAPEYLINDGRDKIALTLMQCAIAYGDKTRRCKECIKILQDAIERAGSQETRKHINENLQMARQMTLPLILDPF